MSKLSCPTKTLLNKKKGDSLCLIYIKYLPVEKTKILNFTNQNFPETYKTKQEVHRRYDIRYFSLTKLSATPILRTIFMSPPKKVNVVERLSRHLEKGTSPLAAAAYLQQVKKMAPSNPVIHIDDSDVTKPDGYKFEALGIVRDGSQSTSSKNVYKKGYHVTEACVLTSSNHPVSIFFQDPFVF